MAFHRVLLLILVVGVVLFTQAMIFATMIINDEVDGGQRHRIVRLLLRLLIEGNSATSSWDDEEPIYWVMKDAEEA